MEKRRRKKAKARRAGASSHDFAPYRYAPAEYIETFLGWTPWSGGEETPGQCEVLDAYVYSLRQQHEKRDYDAGILQLEDLEVYQPGDTIKNIIRVPAGHGVGKTKVASGVVNHFIDCFTPSIIYTFAPTWDQVKKLLWKEISTDRGGKGLPGRVLENCEIKLAANHFATGTATSDAGGKGTERVQGQHGEYLLFLLDEAEGIPQFVFDAVASMMSGGIALMIMFANPRTRSSNFHKLGSSSAVKSLRLSCLNHPNVREGREIVKGATNREYVRGMLEKHCEVIEQDLPDEHTFTLPFPVMVKDRELPAGSIFKPNAEFLFRVLGIAPKNIADNSFITSGRFEAACNRTFAEAVVTEVIAGAVGATSVTKAGMFDPKAVRMGVDAARYGKDAGTLYIRHKGVVWRGGQFFQQDSTAVVGRIKTEALALAGDDADRTGWSLHIRVDGGGGYGSGIVDQIKNDSDLLAKFPDFRVLEVHFNGTPSDTNAYDNMATEMYAEAAETLLGVRIENPPESLEADLCDRFYKWVNARGVAVKRIESKEDFRARLKRAGMPERSPDDGDGFVLCVGPDHIFHSSWVDDPALLDWFKNR